MKSVFVFKQALLFVALGLAIPLMQGCGDDDDDDRKPDNGEMDAGAGGMDAGMGGMGGMGGMDAGMDAGMAGMAGMDAGMDAGMGGMDAGMGGMDAGTPQPGVVINAPDEGLVTTEEGGQDSFTLSLETEPQDAVVVTVDIGSDEATADPTTLTFDDETWDDPQVVTVTGVDDDEMDGSQEFEVTFEVVSLDTEYNALPVDPVSGVNVDDDDAADVLYCVASGEDCTEDGEVEISEMTEQRVEVWLSGVPSPSVEFDVAIDGANGRASLSPTSGGTTAESWTLTVDTTTTVSGGYGVSFYVVGVDNDSIDMTETPFTVTVTPTDVANHDPEYTAAMAVEISGTIAEDEEDIAEPGLYNFEGRQSDDVIVFEGMTHTFDITLGEDPDFTTVDVSLFNNKAPRDSMACVDSGGDAVDLAGNSDLAPADFPLTCTFTAGSEFDFGDMTFTFTAEDSEDWTAQERVFFEPAE